MILKRCFDLFFAIPGLLVLSPLLLGIACWIRLDSAGPIFFRQLRVGRNGELFRIFKFRTMAVDAEARGRQITVGRDPRVTGSGTFLRKSKLDELPQLVNVVLGDMSLVGPRPEVPRYVAEYSAADKALVLSVRPGITDNASIEYRDENEVLGRAVDPEYAYIHEVLPVKLKYYREYVKQHTLWGDFVIILRTFAAILR